MKITPTSDPVLRQGAKNARILYMSTLPIAEARARLSQIVEEASATHAVFSACKGVRV